MKMSSSRGWAGDRPGFTLAVLPANALASVPAYHNMSPKY